jgi:4-amino-4-deoxy-L-arabinose transferase-like glycosyltransferase
MWSAIRRFANYFLIGFVASFVIYLFIRFDANKILVGIAIGVVCGVALAIGLGILERRFPERPPL